MPKPPPVVLFPDALAPCEPIIAIAVQPPSPPFSGKWADSTVIYNGERILSYEEDKPTLLADLTARQADKDARRTALLQAWDRARVDSGPASPEATAAHAAALQALAAEQRALDHDSYVITARYLVWRITDKPEGKGLTYIGGPDQLGWESAPLSMLMWLALKGQGIALGELTGPLPGS